MANRCEGGVFVGGGGRAWWTDWRQRSWAPLGGFIAPVATRHEAFLEALRRRFLEHDGHCLIRSLSYRVSFRLLNILPSSALIFRASSYQGFQISGGLEIKASSYQALGDRVRSFQIVPFSLHGVKDLAIVRANNASDASERSPKERRKTTPMRVKRSSEL